MPTAADEPLQPLYAHSKRPRWGLAILAWEGREQRHYQFQDGQLRIFKKGYYELLEEVERPRELAVDIVRDLQQMLRLDRGRRDAGGSVAKAGFDERLAAFLSHHPKAFADPRWIAEHRSADGSKRKKQHRDPAIREAQERLAPGVLDAAIAAGRYGDVCESVRALLGATDLAGSKDAGALRHLQPHDEEDFVKAVRDLAWGEGPYRERLRRYLSVLARSPGERVTWPLATALSALLHPHEHAFVKPSVVRREAQWLAPSLPYDAAPSAELYSRMLAMIASVRSRLERAGHVPRDFFDVTDFLALAIRPRARGRTVAGAPPDDGG
jgi:hypothetical protein